MPYCSGNTKGFAIAISFQNWNSILALVPLLIISLSWFKSEKKNKTMAEEKECSESSNLSSPMAETPIRPVVCLKRKEDVKLYEETEECFILDFDPFESLDFSKLSLENKNNTNDDDTSDISIVAEKGQVNMSFSPEKTCFFYCLLGFILHRFQLFRISFKFVVL